MKILFIGNYRDGTGWGNAGLGYIQALATTNHDIYCKPIHLNNKNIEPPEIVKELESKKCKNPDVVIQHVLPHLMDYNGKIPLNIGLFASETSNFISSGWQHKLNTMDLVWVVNSLQVQQAKESNVTKKIQVMPHAFDVNKYSYGEGKQPKDETVFYFIGELNQRKNIEAIVRAFQLLTPEKKYSSKLVLKLSVPGLSPSDAKRKAKEYIDNIKRDMKLYDSMDKYAPETIITDYWTDEQIQELHKSCDVFICASRGEAWCIPAFEALAHGNMVLYTRETGPIEYSHVDNIYGIRSSDVIVTGCHDTFGNLYTSRETWKEIDESCLSYSMNLFEKDNIDLQELKAHINKFSYETIGKRMDECITKYLQS